MSQRAMHANDPIPVGTSFRNAYLRPQETASDSPRMRERLHSWLDQQESNDLYRITRQLRVELGVTLSGTSALAQLRNFFRSDSIGDVLSAVRHVYVGLRGPEGYVVAKRWVEFVERVFREENLCYRVDAAGGVRYVPDEAFAAARVSVITALGGARHAAVRHAFERGHESLASQDRDTRAAVRSVFEAAETLVKLVLDSGADLNASTVKGPLKAAVTRHYATVDPSAQAFADQLIETFAKWVDTGHKYRHGPKAEEPHAPPLELAVAYLDAAAPFIRFLASFDNSVAQAGKAASGRL